MFAPEGYIQFDELSKITKEIARDLCWAYRSEESEANSVRVSSSLDERAAVQCWLMANLISYEKISICSPEGVVLRGSPLLAQHLDKLEMLPCPLPFEASTVEQTDYGSTGSIKELWHFYRRFIYFDWDTGNIKTTNEIHGSKPDWSAFGADMSEQLEEKFEKIGSAVSQFSGWSICIKESELSENEAEFVAAFGVDEQLIEKVNANAVLPFRRSEVKRGRPRKIDEAMEAYWLVYPDGHKIAGVNLKFAAYAVSKEIGDGVSTDTLRRGLGKKD